MARVGGKANARDLAAALYASFALLFLASIAAFVVSQQSQTAEGWVAHTLEVRRINQALYVAVQDATLGERGYLITNDRGYLAQYERAKAAVPVLDARLAGLARDNPAAEARISALREAARGQIGDLDQTIGLLEQGRPDAAIAAVRAHLLTGQMERVRAASDAVEQGEATLLRERELRAAAWRWALGAAIGVSLLASVILGVFVAVAARRSLRDLAERNLALRQEMNKREATESQLRQAVKMEALGQLTGGIAHDFNNTLAIVIGNLDILARRLEADDGRRTLVERALEGAHRSARLTQSLLAFSRQQPLAPSAVDVNRSVAELSKLLRGALGEEVVIEAVLAGGLWPAFIDPPQLESAILNLALNGRDAMPQGGKLTIETANAYLDEDYVHGENDLAAGQYVLVAVTDTGLGMPADVIQKAFDPFFTTKAVGKGTGLGLSQVHGFVKQSGGHVKLYSELGGGTTVKLYLPRARQATHAEADLTQQPLAAVSGAVVLVVEDDAEVRAFACGALADLGYKALEAGDGEAALVILRRTQDIALLLTDVVMPGMNGRALAAAALELRPDLKVLFMTGYTRNAIVHNGVLDHDARLITKPFTLAVLASRLNEALTG